MRAIAIASAIFLVVVATASGSRQQTISPRVAQQALEAPRPATAKVVCVKATSCVAIGGSNVLVERAGKWTAVHRPSAVNLQSVACPAAGKCVASGSSGERNAVLLTQAGTKWHLTKPALPGTPADSSFPALSSVSCTSAGNCIAVGSYRFPQNTPLVVKEEHGTWGDAAEPGLPANAATVRNPSYPDAGGGLSLASCPSASDCTAVGTYTNRDAQYSQYGWVSGDVHGPAMVQLPEDAKIYGDSERSGTSPFFGFTGLSCPSAGNCTAVGGYWGGVDRQQGLILKERGGTWHRGREAPVPRNAGPNSTGPNGFQSPLQGISCAATDDCAAIGWYVDKSKRRHGLLLTERNAKWRASELVLPVMAPRTALVSLSSVTCASPGNCVAVGYYAIGGRTYGLIVVERGGTWGRAIKAALPRNAAPAAHAHTFLNAVSCPSAQRCTVVGDYADRAGKARGLILNLRLG